MAQLRHPQKRRHRAARLVRAARWLPACLRGPGLRGDRRFKTRRPRRAQAVRAPRRAERARRRRVHAEKGGGRRWPPPDCASIRGRARAAVKAIAARAAGEKRSETVIGSARRRRRRRAEGVGRRWYERAGAARGDALTKVRTSQKQARAEKAALVALGVLCAGRAAPTRTASACAQSRRRRRRRPRTGPRSAGPRSSALARSGRTAWTSRQLNSRRRSSGPRPKARLLAAAARIASAVLSSKEGTAPSGVLRAAQRRASRGADRERSSCNATEHQRRVVLRAAVRGPAAHGAERPAEPVLWVGQWRSRWRRRPPRGATRYPQPSRRRPQSRRPWNDNSSQRSPLDGRRAGRAARGADFQARAQEEDVEAGPPPPHLTPARRRHAGERLDAELDALKAPAAAGRDRVRPRARRRAARACGLRAARGRRLLPRPNRTRARTSDDYSRAGRRWRSSGS